MSADCYGAPYFKFQRFPGPRLKRRPNFFLVVLTATAFASAILFGCTGCTKNTREFVKSLPPGTGMQYSVSGVQVSPESLSPVNFGTTTLAIQLPHPDGKPVLNRYNLEAGLGGVKSTSTVASGPVGEELEKIGPEGLKAILDPASAPLLPAIAAESGDPSSSEPVP